MDKETTEALQIIAKSLLELARKAAVELDYDDGEPSHCATGIYLDESFSLNRIAGGNFS